MFDQELALNLLPFFVFHRDCCQTSRVNRILAGVATTAVILSAGCGFFGAPEEVRKQSDRTVYRVPGGSLAEMESPTPVPQRVAGESKKN